MPMMMKKERLTDRNRNDLGGDVDGGSDGDEFLGVQLMTMYKYGVKNDTQCCQD